MTRPDASIDVVVAGYLGVDLTPGFAAARATTSFSDLFQPGKLIETEGLAMTLGGVVANTGLALHRFGRRVALMGSVGCDALGDLAIARLQEAGLAAGIRRRRDAGTAYGIVIAPPGMDRLFLEDPGCNRLFTADDIDWSIVQRSRLLHLGYPPLMPALWREGGRELQRLLRQARQCGAMTSLDMALPDPQSPAGQADWPAILAASLPLVDFFVPSIEELLFMLEPTLYDRLLAQAVAEAGGDMIQVIPADCVERLAGLALDLGAKVVLLKVGSRGAYLRSGELGSLPGIDPAGCPGGAWVAPFPVEPARFRNACGAGDCAVAAFLAALLQGTPLLTAGRYAMLAGRDNLYASDAISGLNDWSHMTRQVQSPECPS